MKSIFKAVAIVTIFSVLTRTLGFVFRIFLSRKLGAEGIGLYQMASSILGIFMTLIASGIPLTTAKFVSKYESKNDLVKRNKIVTSALVVALSIAILSSFLIFILKSVWYIVLTDSRAVEILIILIPSMIFSSIYAVFRGALWGKSDYFNCGLTELLEQIIRFALTFIMLLSVSDFLLATKYSAIAFNITCFISAFITFALYLKSGKLNFKSGEYKNIIKSATPITCVRLASSLVQPLTTLIIPTLLILSGYTKSEAVASFGVIMGMTFPMLFVPMAIVGSISMVLIPSLSSMMSKNDYDSINKNITDAISISTFISMLFIPLYLSVGNIIGLVLYNNSMSGILLQLSAVCVFPITMCNLTGSILNALNLEIKSFINYIFGSIALFVSLVV
ncbi:MAG: oligosaccharide flippase family protein, partial [Clostridia bacterium]|nr:oligosaccharide flippase family protein [Clostridia bacterium]